MSSFQFLIIIFFYCLILSDPLNEPRELKYIAKKKQESKAFKNFIRGIHNKTTQICYTEWLRNDIMKFAHSQKIVFKPEEMMN